MARAAAGDVVDAAVVLLAGDGDEILTSDAEDLAATSRTHVELVAV